MIVANLKVISRIHGGEALKGAAIDKVGGAPVNHVVWPISNIYYQPLSTIQIPVNLPDTPTAEQARSLAETAIRGVAGFGTAYLDQNDVIGPYHYWNGTRWVGGNKATFQYGFALGFEQLGVRAIYEKQLAIGQASTLLTMDFVILVAP